MQRSTLIQSSVKEENTLPYNIENKSETCNNTQIEIEEVVP